MLGASPQNKPFILTLVLLSLGALGSCGTRYSASTEDTRRCTGPHCVDGVRAETCGNRIDCASEQLGDDAIDQPLPSPPPHEGPCTLHNDCSVGQLCDVATGACVECLTNAHCDPEEVCMPGGTCGPGSGCSSSADCSGSLVCDSSTRTCVQCLTNQHCDAHLVCVAHTCQSCTLDAQCSPGQTWVEGSCEEATSPEVPPEEPPTHGDMGESCAGEATCMAGLTCVSLRGDQFCTQPCIGSGKGNGVDCPSGFACFKFGADTFALCMPASVMIDATGTPLSGAPYTIQPGQSCAAGNACQTLHCDATTQQCLRRCNADRDCTSAEVCYTAWVPKESPATGVEILDVHYCVASNTTSYLPTGATCDSGAECDSGVCTGLCTNHPSQTCNSADDCTSGTCSGTCAHHCRSNIDCASGTTCAGWRVSSNASGYSHWSNVCQGTSDAGPLQDGSLCYASSECSSQWCVGGICSSTCSNDSDCVGALSQRTCKITMVGDGAGALAYSTQFCQ